MVSSFNTSTFFMVVEMKDMVVSTWERIVGGYPRRPIAFYAERHVLRGLTLEGRHMTLVLCALPMRKEGLPVRVMASKNALILGYY